MMAAVSFLSAAVFVLLFSLHVSVNHKQLHWANPKPGHCTEPITSVRTVYSGRIFKSMVDDDRFSDFSCFNRPWQKYNTDKPNSNADIGMSVRVVLFVSTSLSLLTC